MEPSPQAPVISAGRAHRLGLIFISIYVLLTSAKEVFLGNLEQNIDPMLMLLACFAAMAVAFNLTQLGNGRAYAAGMRNNLRDVVILNAFTLAAWVGDFATLRYLEPAIAGAIIVGTIPLTTLLVSRMFRRDAALFRSDLISALGIVLTSVFLVIVVFGGASGAGQVSTGSAVVGVVWAVIGAAAVAGVAVFSRRLHDGGMSTNQVMSCRFFLLLAVCLVYVLVKQPALEPLISRAWTVALIVPLGLILPLYVAQRGLELADPVAFSLLDSLAPIIIFFLQGLDQRLSFSSATLGGTAAMTVFVAWGTVQRYRRVR